MRFGQLEDGRTAGLYILESPDGTRAAVTDYGAALVSLAVADRDGVYRDVVLGHDDATGYENGGGFIGATVGRFANRIAGAGFELDGKTYGLMSYNGGNLGDALMAEGGSNYLDMLSLIVREDSGTKNSGARSCPNSLYPPGSPEIQLFYQ